MLTVSMLILALLPGVSSAGSDLELVSVDVVQVVVNPDLLVANKSATMRIFIENTFYERKYVDIEVIYDFGRSSYLERGPDGTGVPLDPGMNLVYLPGGWCQAHPAPWETALPAFKWTSSGVDSSVFVKMDPDNRVPESDESNNLRSPADPVHVVSSREIKILVQPMYNSRRPSLYPFNFSLEEEIQQLIDIYPIADDGLTVVEAPPKWVSFRESPDADFDELAALTKELSFDARMLGYDRVIAVFKSAIYEDRRAGITQEINGCAVAVLDEPRDPVPVYITARGIENREFLLAHEIGHTYYLWHPHDSLGLHVYNATKFSAREKVYGQGANTFMSYPYPLYLPRGVPLSPRWIDRERYEDYPRSYIDLRSYSIGPNGTWQWNLVDQLCLVPPTLDRVIVLQMTFLRDGSVKLEKPWFRLPMGVADEMQQSQYCPPGNYSVRMLDASLNELGRTYFNVSFTKLTHFDEASEMFSVREVDSVDVVLNVRDYPGTKYVRIVDASESILAERELSSSAPSVSVLSPNGDERMEIGDVVQISWNATDPDGDNLTYFLAYSPDDNQTWVPIANGVTDRSYLWNTTGVAPTTKCRVKVMASDGVNTAEDVSDSIFEMYDSIAPVTRAELNGTLGENGWYLSAVNVTLMASDNSRILRTQYSFDNSTWTAYDGPFSVSSEAANSLYFRSEDLAMNLETAKSVSVKIDLSPPQITILSPTNGSTMKLGDEFFWNATDNVSGVARYEVRLNSGPWTDAGLETHWMLSQNVTGPGTFEVRAYDSAGNIAARSVEFEIAEPGGGIPWEILLGIAVAISAVAIGIGVYLWKKNKK